MVQVTVPKTEYEQLKRQAQAYRRVLGKIFESAIKDPIEDVVEDFRNTGLYTKEFLRDLRGGLRKSSYAKKHAIKTSPSRS